MGVGPSVIQWFQPICNGPMPTTRYKDLLQLNLWDNKPNELTNFCAGTPMWSIHDAPRQYDSRTLGIDADIPVWTPLCRCTQMMNGDYVFRCHVPFWQGRRELVKYCKDHCHCKDVPGEWREKKNVWARGGLQNLPPEIKKYDWIENNDGSLTCSQSCMGFLSCSDPRTKGHCGNMVCMVQQQIGQGLFQAGVCVAATALKSSSQRLGGRAAEQPLCACNSTYVSSACCGATNDGIVWEDQLQKIGIVSLQTFEDRRSPK